MAERLRQAPADDGNARFIDRPRGFDWQPEDGYGEYESFDAPREAVKDARSRAEWVDPETGIVEWIDLETDEPAEEERPHREDH